MQYKVHTSPNSKEIKRLVVFFPGMDDLTEKGSQEAKTSNNIDKYDLFAKVTAKISEPGVAVIVPEYSGPHAWGKPINFEILTNEIEKTLTDAINGLVKNNFDINIEKINLGVHSYGFTALFWSLFNNIFPRVIQKEDGKFTIDLHLFEPYGIASVQVEQTAGQNTPAFREPEIIKAAQKFGFGKNPHPAQTAQDELSYLRTIDAIKNIDIMLGMFMPYAYVHNTYGSINANEIDVKLIKLNNVKHGGAFIDILTAMQKNSLPPDFALTAFQILMHAWTCSLRGIKIDDPKAKKIQEEILKQFISDTKNRTSADNYAKKPFFITWF